MSNKLDTLFLDRDGVINYKIDGGYVSSIEEFIFIPDFLAVISKLNLMFKRIIIVTNQQGIGKKLMTDLDLDNIHRFMLNKIKEVNGRIDKIYYCPHLILDDCDCRKPKSGMILNALQDFTDINISSSYLVGDSESDIDAAQKEGVKSVKVNSHYTILNWYQQMLKY
tara:strand:- start:8573 stop:9073 length:501 start_codon:yes stop_codon:yes gene_type:complete